MQYRFIFILVMLALVASVAGAHPGPRVWLSIDNQKVRTYAGSYPPGSPSDYSLSRVFTQALTDEGDDLWDTDYPGFQIVPGGTIPSGTNFSFSLAGPLLWYNAGDASHLPKYQTVASRFGASAPQFVVNNELFQYATTASGPVPGYLAFAYYGSAGDHNHLLYTLLGDGVNPEGAPDGIFALPLIFSASAANTQASDPFFLLLGKNASAAQLANAAVLARQTLLLPGDANADGVVSFADYQRLELGLGKADPYPSDGDFNFDGVVNFNDFKLLNDNYGRHLTGQAPLAADIGGLTSTVPEPGVLSALALFVTAGALRRPRRV